MKKLPVKAVLSTLLMLLFCYLAFSGALLYFGKTGVILGIPRYVLRETHFWAAASMCVLIPLHLILNLGLYKAELRSLGSKRRNPHSTADKAQSSKDIEYCEASSTEASDKSVIAASEPQSHEQDALLRGLQEEPEETHRVSPQSLSSVEPSGELSDSNEKTTPEKPKKKLNSLVYLSLALLLAAVAFLSLLNRGDAELRRALSENREFQVLVDGSLVSTVDLQGLLDLEPQEFTTSFATSISAPRDVKLRGVELRLLLEALAIDYIDASHVTVSGLDSYYSPLTLNELLQEERIYVCFSMDGELLKPQNEGGYGPFLMVIRGSRFAQRWCKYVEAVDVIS